MRIVVPQGEHRKRIDVYLAHQIENASRSKVQQAIEAGAIRVNGKLVKPSYMLAPNDVIEVILPKQQKPEILPENIPLEIVYEDEVLLVVNKPAGMVTHPAYGHYTGTLVNALLYHSNSLSTVNTELRPGIVHRLDKDTSGLLVVAKNDRAHHFLAKQFSARTVEREYWAVVWGKFRSLKGIIEASLGRSKRDRKKVIVIKDGKHAITEYEVLDAWEYLSLVCLRLKTGRTHQIRVHLAYIGHPVFGDPTYSGRDPSWGGLSGKLERQAEHLLTIIHRQALHAKTIGFVHPVSREWMKFDSDLPADMGQVVNYLRLYSR
ncbi:MAG: RluA family pseudouridine synthase [Bacteroidetes bacterium]|nr:RluA family pseudouridine synthase [Bacteroidota bacterium]